MALVRVVRVEGGKAVAKEVARLADAVEALLLAAYNIRMRPSSPPTGADESDVEYADDLSTLGQELRSKAFPEHAVKDED